MYKIQRTTDNLFSTGGFKPRFNKNGKIWNSRGNLINHCLLVQDKNVWPYEDCICIEFEMGRIIRVFRLPRYIKCFYSYDKKAWICANSCAVGNPVLDVNHYICGVCGRRPKVIDIAKTNN